MGRYAAPGIPCQPARRPILLWAASAFVFAATIEPLAAYDIQGHLPAAQSGKALFALIAASVLVAAALVPGVVHLLRHALRDRRAFQQEIAEGRRQLDRAVGH